MATQAIAANVPFGAVKSLREYNLVTEIFAAFATWRQKHNTRTELLKLSPEQLEDIGLVRADIV